MVSTGETMIMKNPIKPVFVLLLSVVSVSIVNAQTTREATQPSDLRQYEGWQKIDLGIFSFYAPKELRGGERRGIDSRAWKYESDNLILEIDAGLYSGYPTLEREKPSYREKFLRINGASAWIWFYEEEKSNFKYIGGVHFSFKGLNEAITMSLSSKDSDGQKISEKIFMSVRFNFRLEEEKTTNTMSGVGRNGRSSGLGSAWELIGASRKPTIRSMVY
jgi:hypothetical protein